MTVKELIEKLQKYPEDTEVFVKDNGETYEAEEVYYDHYKNDKSIVITW